jgi:hypothetical protein
MSQDDVLAFTERFLRDSKSHQRQRTQVRWLLPLLIIAHSVYRIWKDDYSWPLLVFYGGFSFLWWLLFPLWFDARIRAHAKKQMEETSYSRMLGSCEIRLLDEHIESTSPAGSSTLMWASVDRVDLDSEYLWIFLSGPQGYPIRVAEIGQEAARAAHDFVAARIAASRVSDRG